MTRLCEGARCIRYCPMGEQWAVRVNDGARMLLHGETVQAIIAAVRRGHAQGRYEATIMRVGGESV